jgi:hypothetical protein
MNCINLMLKWEVLFLKSTKVTGEKSAKMATCSQSVHHRRLLQNSPAMLSNEKQEQFGVIIVHIANVTKKGRADNCQCESLWKNLPNQGWDLGNSSGIDQPFLFSLYRVCPRHLRTSSSWLRVILVSASTLSVLIMPIRAAASISHSVWPR